MSRHQERVFALGRDTLGYGVVHGLALVSGLVTLPVLTRALSSAAYGQLDLLISVAVLTGTLVRLGVPITLSRVFAQKQKDGSLAEFYSTSYTALAGLALLLVAGAFLAGTWLPESTTGDRAPHLLAIATAIGGTQALLSAPEMVLRMERRLVAYGAGHALITLSYLGTLLLFARTELLTLEVTLLVSLGAQLLGLSVFSYRARHLFRLSWRPTVLIESLRFGGPLLLGRLSGRTVDTLARSVLIARADLVEASLLAAATRLVRLATAPLELALKAWQPSVMPLLGEADVNETVRRDFRIFLTVGALVSLAAVAAAPLLIGLLTPRRFTPAADLVPWFASAALLQGATSFARIGAIAARRTRAIAWVVVSSNLSGLGLTTVLASSFGAAAVAYGLFASQSVACVGCWLLSLRATGLRLDAGFFARKLLLLGAGSMLLQSPLLLSGRGVGPRALVLLLAAVLLMVDLALSTKRDAGPTRD